ncbi:4-alpha-glucanotransferase [Actinorugispora endophytica]|uniref:4-alpha-glucanotransferase n=1 Tax=Actinorugispora endophytica TaxID=1605990 RepID=A0A4R6UTS6_9ACTN|nr:4-alpha-glucanotransferase [Actinorugispora endophytica]TDQ48755.1 4-alpha-glucanotransferase [Actinorugispora endophytica]
MSDAELVRLAEEHGVSTSYVDWRGDRVDVPPPTLRHVLGVLGLDVDDPRAALRAHRERRAGRLLPVSVVVRRGRAPDVPLPDGARAWVELSGGGTVVPGPDLPLGAHLLRVEYGRRGERAPLLVVPDRLPAPRVPEGRRLWGLMAQLYSVRSRASWAMGDLRDLAELSDWAARDLGASFTLVNPIHATEPVPPLEPSPYLPVSRRYVTPLYIRVEDVPEYAGLRPVHREAVQRLARPLRERSRTADLIDRDAVWRAKRAALEILFQARRDPDREEALRAYLDREGDALVKYATWCAIAEEYGFDHRRWPERLRDPDGAGARDEALRRRPAVDFHRWVQWLMDEQLAAAQASARAAGMGVGIVHDLAVGVQSGGADAWMYGDALTAGVRTGAPPDEFNQQGQDWGQPPWHPVRLAEQGYLPFAEQMRQAMRHAGGIRVDHVMGLFRLWWVPEGASPAEGAYVRYDHEGMVGALLLAAHEAGALVVGEDLGTVEPWVRDHLAERGILGTSVLWFERDEANRPRRPETWRADCLATVATHDLPPVASFVSAEHVDLRDHLGLLTRPVERERAEAESQVAAWRAMLVDLGLLDPSVDPVSDPAAVVVALHGYLRRTPSRMVGVALTDLVGDHRMQNQPGTSTEYPNWRIPLTDAEGVPVLLDDLVTGQDRVAAVRAALGPLADVAPRPGPRA